MSVMSRLKRWSGLGKEREQIKKLISLLKSPWTFFEKNNDNGELLSFMAFSTRFVFILYIFIFLAVFYNQVMSDTRLIQSVFFIYSILPITVFLIFPIPLLSFLHKSCSGILNHAIKIIYKKDNMSAAERVIAYTWVGFVFSIIFSFSIGSNIVRLVALYLVVVGVFHQFKLSLKASVLISLISYFVNQLFLVLLVMIVFFLYSLGRFILHLLYLVYTYGV